jgi:hypothetical protein
MTLQSHRSLPTFRVNLLLPYAGWMSECLKLIKNKGRFELALGHVKTLQPIHAADIGHVH